MTLLQMSHYFFIGVQESSAGRQISRDELEVVRDVKASLTRLMTRVERIRKARAAAAQRSSAC